jgi:hypothetical protein
MGQGGWTQAFGTEHETKKRGRHLSGVTNEINKIFNWKQI